MLLPAVVVVAVGDVVSLLEDDVLVLTGLSVSELRLRTSSEKRDDSGWELGSLRWLPILCFVFAGGMGALPLAGDFTAFRCTADDGTGE